MISSVDDLLVVMLVITLIASIVLAMIGSMSIGRKVVDLEYQKARKLNGIRTIQTWINLRVQLGRVLLAVAFATTALMSLIDAPLLLRMWVGRGLFIVVIIAFAISAIQDWLDERKQMYIIIDEEGRSGFTAARIRAHIINNKLNIASGIVELASNETSKNDDNALEELRFVLHDVEEQFKELQLLVRDMDPAYKIEKESMPQHLGDH